MYYSIHSVPFWVRILRIYPKQRRHELICQASCSRCCYIGGGDGDFAFVVASSASYGDDDSVMMMTVTHFLDDKCPCTHG